VESDVPIEIGGARFHISSDSIVAHNGDAL